MDMVLVAFYFVDVDILLHCIEDMTFFIKFYQLIMGEIALRGLQLHHIHVVVIIF